MKSLQIASEKYLEDTEIIDNVYAYTFQLDLQQEITDVRVATTLLMLEQGNDIIMNELVDSGMQVLTPHHIIGIANKLRLLLLESTDILSFN